MQLFLHFLFYRELCWFMILSNLRSLFLLDEWLEEIYVVIKQRCLASQQLIALLFALLWYPLHFSLDQCTDYDPILLMLGNKCDLEDERKVSIEMGRQVSASMFAYTLNSGICLPQVHMEWYIVALLW